jgi:hypothetical protein
MIEAFCTEAQHDEPNYPCLMIHKEDLLRGDPFIGLFINDSTAVIVSINSDMVHNRVGVNTNMDIEEFVLYHGSVTIRNAR